MFIPSQYTCVVHKSETSTIFWDPLTPWLTNEITDIEFRVFNALNPDFTCKLTLKQDNQVVASVNEGFPTDPHGYWRREWDTTLDILWHPSGRVPEKPRAHRFQLIPNTCTYRGISPDHDIYLMPWIMRIPGPAFTSRSLIGNR